MWNPLRGCLRRWRLRLRRLRFEIPKDMTMPETAEAETPEAEAEIPKDVCRRWNRQLASHPKPVFDMVD